MHHNPSHIFMFNLLHLLFSMQSSNESLHYFQMTFTRQYDLSLNRVEFNLFVLEKIKFQYTLREREILQIIQYQFLFEFMLSVCGCHLFLHCWLLLSAFHGVISAFVLFHLLGARNAVQQFLQYKRISFGCKSAGANYLMNFLCILCASVYLLNIFAQLCF